MKIKQTYSKREDRFGTQEINFIVSDDYAELFNTDNIDINTDIFIFDSNKQDLELKKFIQAVDEFDFSIRQTSIKSQSDEEAMFFCLDATNAKVARYCAAYFGSVSENNLFFVGKIDASIGGDDIVHKKDDWVDDLGVQREYKFNALSIDLALIEDALFLDPIDDSEGNNIDNVYTRIRASSHSILNAITVTPTCYTSSTPSPETIKHRGQVNTFDAINMYLDLASDIINEKHSISIDFSFEESELGFEVSPTEFEFATEGYGLINKCINDHDQLIKIRLSDTTFEIDGSDIYSTLMIHRGNIDPEVYNDGDINVDWTNELSFSWIRFNNVGNLIFSLARALGCFIKRTYSSTGVVLKFVPRQSFGNATSKYLIGALSGGITADVESNSERTDFEEYANYMYYSSPSLLKHDLFAKRNEMTEDVEVDESVAPNRVYDRLSYKEWDGKKFVESPSTDVYLNVKEDYQKSKSNKVDFPVSSTIAMIRNHQRSGTRNIKAFRYEIDIMGGWLFNTHVNNDSYLDLGGSKPKYISESSERILSALNVYCTNPETATGIVLRPIFYIYYKRGTENKEVGSLTQMMQDIEQTEKEVYKTIYTLKVPYWNAFANDESGTGASWKNVELGGSIYLNENIKKFNGIDFDDVTLVNEYTIISIQRNLQKPETTLKLQLKSRFAFGYYDSLTFSETEISIQEPIESSTTSESILTSIDDSNYFRTYPIKTGETITEGECVSLDSVGEIVKTKSQSSQNAKVLGICTSVSGTQATVLITGIVGKDGWSWAEIGGDVFCVTNAGNNLTQSGLFTISGSEDLTIFVGTAINDKEIYVKPEQYKLV